MDEVIIFHLFFLLQPHDKFNVVTVNYGKT